MSLKVVTDRGFVLEYKKVDNLSMDSRMITVEGEYNTREKESLMFVEGHVFDKHFRNRVKEIIWRNDE